MHRIIKKVVRRQRRKRGLRRIIRGVPSRPRLTVFRSARHIYAQVVDDLVGRTLASASTVEGSAKPDNGGNCDAARQVGQRIAERLKATGVDAVVFDRNGFRYHGRIKALADAARKAGLNF